MELLKTKDIPGAFWDVVDYKDTWAARVRFPYTGIYYFKPGDIVEHVDKKYIVISKCVTFNDEFKLIIQAILQEYTREEPWTGHSLELKFSEV